MGSLWACIREIETELTPGSDGVVFEAESGGYRWVLLRHSIVDADKPDLSPRETEMANMVALGHPNKVIAGILDLSEWTVSTYLRRVFAKLNVSSRAAMVAKIGNSRLTRVQTVSRTEPIGKGACSEESGSHAARSR